MKVMAQVNYTKMYKDLLVDSHHGWAPTKTTMASSCPLKILNQRLHSSRDQTRRGLIEQTSSMGLRDLHHLNIKPNLISIQAVEESVLRRKKKRRQQQRFLKSQKPNDQWDILLRNERAKPNPNCKQKESSKWRREARSPNQRRHCLTVLLHKIHKWELIEPANLNVKRMHSGNCTSHSMARPPVASRSPTFQMNLAWKRIRCTSGSGTLRRK